MTTLPSPAMTATLPTAVDSSSLYLRCLMWSFALFSLGRVIAYLPTVWVIGASGDSSQYSLLTWLTWFGANLTMAAFLYEQAGRRCNRIIGLNVCNAGMCLLTVCVILAHRV
jgi:hypothetical protein